MGNPIPKVINIKPNCLRVDNAIIFFISTSPELYIFSMASKHTAK